MHRAISQDRRRNRARRAIRGAGDARTPIASPPSPLSRRGPADPAQRGLALHGFARRDGERGAAGAGARRGAGSRPRARCWRRASASATSGSCWSMAAMSRNCPTARPRALLARLLAKSAPSARSDAVVALNDAFAPDGLTLAARRGVDARRARSRSCISSSREAPRSRLFARRDHACAPARARASSRLRRRGGRLSAQRADACSSLGDGARMRA